MLTLTSKEWLGKATLPRQNCLPPPSRTSCKHWNGIIRESKSMVDCCFGDDVVFITTNVTQAERMLADFDKAYGRNGLRVNLTKTMFVKNGLVCYAPFRLKGTNAFECSSYVYLGRKINMMNDLAPELSRRKRAAWGAFKSIEDVVKKTKITRLHAHLFDSAVLSALTYGSET
uniref:Reverse transcriptase domain-containing protein n=1 Tax=Angiostrongylus cantonensis TaxID=6313 RepID=A0A0K0D1C3_ANGCA